MAYTLTNEERETVFLYNQAEKIVHVSTMDPALIRKLDNLSDSDEAITRREARDGYREYDLPKKYLKIRPTQKLSDEKRQLLVERMRSIRDRKKSNDTEGENAQI